MKKSLICKVNLAVLLMCANYCPALSSDVVLAQPGSTHEMAVEEPVFRKNLWSLSQLLKLAPRLESYTGSARYLASFVQPRDGVEFSRYYQEVRPGQYCSINFETLFESKPRPSDIDLSAVTIDTFKDLFAKISERFPDQVDQKIYPDIDVTPRQAFRALLGENDDLTAHVTNWQKHYVKVFADLMVKKDGVTGRNLATFIYKLKEAFNAPEKQDDVRGIFFNFLIELVTHCAAGFEARVDSVYSRYGSDSFSIENMLRDYKEKVINDLIESQGLTSIEASSVAVRQWFRYKLDALMGITYKGEELDHSISFLEVPHGSILRDLNVQSLAKWLSIYITPSDLINSVRQQLIQSLDSRTRDSGANTAQLGVWLQGFTGDAFEENESGEYVITAAATEYLLSPYLTYHSGSDSPVLYPALSREVSATTIAALTPADVDAMIFGGKRIEGKHLPTSFVPVELIDELNFYSVSSGSSNFYNLFIACHQVGNVETAQHLASLLGLSVVYDSIRCIEDSIDCNLDDVIDFSQFYSHPHLYRQSLEAIFIVSGAKGNVDILKRNIPLLMRQVLGAFGFQLTPNADLGAETLYNSLLPSRSSGAQKKLGEILQWDQAIMYLVSLCLNPTMKPVFFSDYDEESRNYLTNLFEASAKRMLFARLRDNNLRYYISNLSNIRNRNILSAEIVNLFEMNLINYVFRNEKIAYERLLEVGESNLAYLSEMNLSMRMLQSQDLVPWSRFIGFIEFVKIAKKEGKLSDFKNSFGPLVGDSEQVTLTNLYDRYGIKIQARRKDGHQDKLFYWGKKLWLPNTLGETTPLTPGNRPQTKEEWALYFDEINKVTSFNLSKGLSSELRQSSADLPIVPELIDYLRSRPEHAYNFLVDIQDDIGISGEHKELFNRELCQAHIIGSELSRESRVDVYIPFYEDLIAKTESPDEKKQLQRDLFQKMAKSFESQLSGAPVWQALFKSRGSPYYLGRLEKAFNDMVIKFAPQSDELLLQFYQDYIGVNRVNNVCAFLAMSAGFIRYLFEKESKISPEILKDLIIFLKEFRELEPRQLRLATQVLECFKNKKAGVSQIMTDLINDSSYEGNKSITQLLCCYVCQFPVKNSKTFGKSLLDNLDKLRSTPNGQEILRTVLNRYDIQSLTRDELFIRLQEIFDQKRKRSDADASVKRVRVETEQ